MLSGHYDYVPYGVHVVVGIYMIILFILAVGGNGVIVMAFAKHRSLHCRGNVLIVNLSLSDMLMAMTSFPLMITASFKGRWTFGQAVCDFYGSSATAFSLMSINTLVFIALDRLLVIAKPEWSRNIPRWVTGLTIAFIWFYSILWGIMPLVGFGRFFLEGFGTTCTIDYTHLDHPHKYLLLAMLIFDFVLPLAAIVLCYACLLSTIRAHRKRYLSVLYVNAKGMGTNMDLTEEEISIIKSRRADADMALLGTEYRVARTIAIVTLFFCITWAPYAVITMVAQYGNVAWAPSSLAMIPCLFAKTSTVWNPVIYSLYHPKFRPKLRESFPCFYRLYTSLEMLVCVRQRRRGAARGNSFLSSTNDRLRRLIRIISGSTYSAPTSMVDQETTHIPDESTNLRELPKSNSDHRIGNKTTIIFNFFEGVHSIRNGRIKRSKSCSIKRDRKSRCQAVSLTYTNPQTEDSPDKQMKKAFSYPGLPEQNSPKIYKDTNSTKAPPKRRRLSSTRNRKFTNKSSGSKPSLHSNSASYRGRQSCSIDRVSSEMSSH